MAAKDITLDVVEDQAGEDADLLVCARVGQGKPLVESGRDKCMKCEAEVYRSNTAPKKPKAICMLCALPDLLQGDAKMQVTKSTVQEATLALMDDQGRKH